MWICLAPKLLSAKMCMVGSHFACNMPNLCPDLHKTGIMAKMIKDVCHLSTVRHTLPLISSDPNLMHKSSKKKGISKKESKMPPDEYTRFNYRVHMAHLRFCTGLLHYSSQDTIHWRNASWFKTLVRTWMGGKLVSHRLKIVEKVKRCYGELRI